MKMIYFTPKNVKEKGVGISGQIFVIRSKVGGSISKAHDRLLDRTVGWLEEHGGYDCREKN